MASDIYMFIADIGNWAHLRLVGGIWNRINVQDHIRYALVNIDAINKRTAD